MTVSNAFIQAGLTNLVPNVDKYKGNLSMTDLQRKVAELGLNTTLVSKPRGKHEVIPIKDLIPLESQRNVTDTWILKVLKMTGGWDFAAAGLIFVARDPNTKRNYVWDGCGRMHIARAVGLDRLDCWVIEMTRQEAAHYFVHVQKTAKRGLDSSVIFCNAVYHGEPEAIKKADLLKRLGLRVEGADDHWVPDIPAKDLHLYPQVKISAVDQAMKLADGDETIVHFARDTIVQAWPNADMVRQDLLPGLTLVYKCYPEAMKNGLSKAIREFFKGMAAIRNQGKLTFKQTGGNMHNAEPHSVARGIVAEFRASEVPSAAQKAQMPEKRIVEYTKELLGR